MRGIIGSEDEAWQQVASFAVYLEADWEKPHLGAFGCKPSHDPLIRHCLTTKAIIATHSHFVQTVQTRRLPRNWPPKNSPDGAYRTLTIAGRCNTAWIWDLDGHRCLWCFLKLKSAIPSCTCPCSSPRQPISCMSVYFNRSQGETEGKTASRTTCYEQ
jgi:hypothetical protein